MGKTNAMHPGAMASSSSLGETEILSVCTHETIEMSKFDSR